MAIITNYASLIGEVATRTGRSDITAANAELLVQMAQTRIQRDALNEGHVLDEEVSATGTLTANVQTLALPTGYLSTQGFWLTSPYEESLDPVEINRIQSDYANTTGTPEAYSIYSNQLWLSPTPASAIPYRWLYHAKIAQLTQVVTTNWFTANAPDVLYYATLLEASDQVRDDAAVQRYTIAYQSSLAAMMKNMARARYNQSPPILGTEVGARFDITQGY